MSNAKDAANIAVGLGTQLINAALTLVVLSGAFLTFLADKKTLTSSSYIFYFLGFLLLIVSMFLGGKGIARVKKDGEAGYWRTSGKPNWFDLQAISLLAGIICIGILPFTGTKNEGQEKAIQILLDSAFKKDSLLLENHKLQLKTVDTIKIYLQDSHKRKMTGKRKSKHRKCKCPN